MAQLWLDDPRHRRHVLPKADERRHGGRIVVISRWPISSEPARLVAAGDTFNELLAVMKCIAGRDACITAHAAAKSSIPCVLLARKQPRPKGVWR